MGGCQKKTQKDDEIKKLILESNKRSYNGDLSRLKFLLSIGDEGLFPVPALVSEYYEEARLCWYRGAFVATIIMVQLAFEELFRAHYRAANGVGGTLNNGKKVDQASFFDLIVEAQNDRWISKKEAELLHSLRKNIRNPYVHVKDVKGNGKSDLHEANFVTQYLKIRTPELIGHDVKDDAKEAIRLLIVLLPKISYRTLGL